MILARWRARLLELVVNLVQRIGPLDRLINRIAINRLVARVPPRPNPFSTKYRYTSWASLTEREWSGRHLPAHPVDAPVPSAAQRQTATVDAAAALFVRDGEMTACPKSTALFPAFAQWFTDGFLRTDRTRPAGQLRDTRKNESNHEIDLAQLYGLKRAPTEQLRAPHGLLKSQMREDGEYPPYLCQDANVRPEFNELPKPLGFDGLTPDEKNALFAMGSDTRNLGFMAFNVLFLREHNRIARQLREEHGDWGNDQLFETTRNILIMVLIKVVVEDYINHINPSPYQLRLAPASFSKAPWFRTNWMAIEFNLLYRWHSLVPSSFELAGRRLTIEESLSNSQALIDSGLGQFMLDASRQPAGRISLYNTDGFLVGMAEKPSIEQGRAAELRSYNDYRKMCGRPAVKSFLEINSDPRVQEGLATVYGSVDEIEFYVGLFAEEAGRLDVLPPLVHTMVAFDAFSQALTNPLAAPRVFNEETFTATGMAIIKDTKRIADIVERNVPAGSDLGYVGLTQSLFKRY